MQQRSFAQAIMPLSSITNQTASISSMQILDNVNLDSTNYLAKWLKFINVTFLGEYTARNVDLGVGLSFENCVFEGSVEFFNTAAAGYDNEFLFSSKSLYFKKCTFKQSVIISSPATDMKRGIYFDECNLERGLICNRVQVSEHSLGITNTTIKDTFDILQCKFKQGYTIANCLIDSRVRVENVQGDSAAIIKNTFKKDLYVWSGSYTQGITFNDGIFEDDVKLHCNHCGTLNIIGGAYHNEFQVEYQDVTAKVHQGPEHIYLADADFKNGLSVNGTEDVFATPPIVKQIEIKASAKLQGDVYFESLDLGLLKVSGVNTKANLVFDRLFINKIDLDNFYNNAQVVFTNLKASFSSWYSDKEQKIARSSAIYITNSNLGKATLYQADLNSFKAVNLNNVIVSEISTSNITWFDAKLIGSKTEIDWLNGLKIYRKDNNTQGVSSAQESLARHYTSLRELFRQLKYAMEKQSDKPQAHLFRRFEMENYRKQLQITSAGSLNDRLILWLGATNDFGQNWIKPLGLLLGSTFILYIPMAILLAPNLDHSTWVSSWHDVVENLKVVFNTGIRYYPQLLNPAHQLERFAPGLQDRSAGIFFLDLLFRLTTGFFIYQVIVAGRKYSK